MNFHSFGDVTIVGEGTFYGHLREPVIITPNAEPLVLELSLPVFTNYVFCDWDSNTQSFACGANCLAHCATAVTLLFVIFCYQTCIDDI